MKKLNTVILFFVFSLNTLGQKPEKFKNIFDGVTFKGWQIVGSKGKINIKDSAFVCQMTINTPEHTFVKTNKKYRNFVLELDCKRDSFFNTGILFRCQNTSDTASVSLYGYQVKIDPNIKRSWTGGVFDDFGKSWKWLYTLENDAKAKNANKDNDWNHFRVEAINDTIKVWVNDIPTSHLINNKYFKGYIAFKIHSLGNKPEQENWKAAFKNIKIIENPSRKDLKPINIPALKN
ncbi:MAG: DUF1080 domain-containing protein [Pseudarcicella sp.]|nr:DUF1080 domain-containing protein [Pseudarcicella sp.]